MRKYLLSLMAVVMAVTLIGTTSYAFENKSIKAENTFDFYENEFDFMLQPAKLAGQDSTLSEGHKLVEGFTGYRLFTNLTNQAGEDAYQIGAIIPVPNNMGNVGILFDYRYDGGMGSALDCTDCYLADEDDMISTTNLVEKDEEEEAWNLYVGYGIPIPGTAISAGVSYNYWSVDGGRWNIETAGTSNEYDYETHEIALEGRFNQAPIDSLLGISWKNINGEQTDENGDVLFPFCGYGNRQGNTWGINNENIFELNPEVALGLDLAYRFGDFDDRAGNAKGDIENDEFYARAEVRLTFPKVFFGLGTSYDYFEEDGDYNSGGYELELETWGFPVATEFNITERLVGRLGAEFVYADSEVDIWGLNVGNIADDDTTSDTTYNVGLGYQVTENLNVDAMWRHGNNDTQEGTPVKREGVSTDDLYVGATLAF